MFNPRLIIIFILSGLGTSKLFSSIDENKSLPTCFFNAVCFKQGERMDLIYFPWGNENEENATTINLSINSDRLSNKICYYGQSPLKLFVLPSKSRDEAKQDGGEINYSSIEYNFEQSKNEILEEVLLLVGKKIKSFDFSRKFVPIGSFSFQSFAREPLYLKVGDIKFSLNYGGSKIVNLMDEKSSQRLPISILRKHGSKYLESYKRKIFNFRKMRGFFLLKIEEKSIKPFTILENTMDYGKILGYGAKPHSPQKR